MVLVKREGKCVVDSNDDGSVLTASVETDVDGLHDGLYDMSDDGLYDIVEGQAEKSKDGERVEMNDER